MILSVFTANKHKKWIPMELEITTYNRGARSSHANRDRTNDSRITYTYDIILIIVIYNLESR